MTPSALASLANLAELENLTLKKAPNPTDTDWGNFFAQQRFNQEQRCSGDFSARGWRVLILAECELLADGAAMAVSVPQPWLTELDLSWCWHLSNVGLRGVLLSSPQLRFVKLAGSKNLTCAALVPCCSLALLEELDCTSCNSISDDFLEFLHRLFCCVPVSSDEGLPRREALPPCVAQASDWLWAHRLRGSARLRIKNYYAEYLNDWLQFNPVRDVVVLAEEALSRVQV